MDKLKVQFLGTRGSVAVDSKEYKIYGGATMCTLIKINNTNIILDAGTGFMNIDKHLNEDDTEINIFISHTHLDHINGLLVNKIMFNPRMKINIYAVKRNNLSIKEQINLMMREPIWPVDTTAFTANVEFFDITCEINIDGIKINTIDGNHPGKVSIFKISKNDKSIVYATDYEIEESNIEEFINFSKNTDLLILDGQYCDEIKEEKKGFGHSSWQDAVKLSKKINCKQLYITHHDPYSSDEYLKNVEEKVRNENKNYFLAKSGEGVSI